MAEFTVEVDNAALLALLREVGDHSAAFYCKETSFETVNLVAREAKSRLARAKNPTGATANAIRVEPLRGDAIGYALVQASVVAPARRSSRMIKPTWSDAKSARYRPRFLEHGTKFMTERPYFDASAALEYPGHRRRLAEALQRALDVRK